MEPTTPNEPQTEHERIDAEHSRRVWTAIGVTLGVMLVIAVLSGLGGQTICIGPLVLYIIYRIVYDKQDLKDRRRERLRRRR